MLAFVLILCFCVLYYGISYVFIVVIGVKSHKKKPRKSEKKLRADCWNQGLKEK